jgi:hypothetical protein
MRSSASADHALGDVTELLEVLAHHEEAVAPPPVAAASCFVLVDRTSPAAKTPSLDVSKVSSVTMNPHRSRSSVPFRNPVFGSSPTKTKAAAG